MSNTRRPAKSQPAKTKAVKKKVQKRQPVAMMPAPQVATMPVPKMATVNEFIAGPVPVPDVRQEGRYVYGIIQSREPISFGRMGIGGSGEMVHAGTHGDIDAVVSRTPVFIFDPTRENALAHEHVIETVMKTHTIIPMSFGTVFRTDDDIREVLRSIYPSVKDVLKQMSGKVEFGLKVTWDRDHIVEELQREHEEIHRFHQEITRKHLQSTYFARMQLGRMIDKALEERSVEYVREIYESLRAICVASRDNKPIGDKMIMNAAFLLEREREAEFDAAVNRVAKKFGDRLNFKYTGPWPPYNFVNIRLKLDGVVMVHHSLRGLVKRELLFGFVPDGDGGVHFHRVVRFDRGDVSVVCLDRGLCVGTFGAAARILEHRWIYWRRRLPEQHQRLRGLVVDANCGASSLRLFERFGDDQRNILAVVIDHVVFEGRSRLAGANHALESLRRTIHGLDVTVMNDPQDTGHFFGRARVDADDSTGTDSTGNRHAVGDAFDSVLRAIGRGAAYLQLAVDSRNRLSDDRGAHVVLFSRCVHASVVTTRSARTRQSCTSLSLKALSCSGRAPRTAAEAAAWKVFSPTGCPSSSFSASRDRQGLVATPPSATRAERMRPSLTRTTTAADDRANS